MKKIFLQENASDAVSGTKDVLAQGGVVLYPTDTVYGLGADALNKEAVDTIRYIKGREDAKPLLVMVNGIDMLKQYAVVGKLAEQLTHKYWPGALTLILNCTNKKLLKILGGKDGKVGFRMPNNPFCLELLEDYPNPIISTSANISGKAQPSSVKEILEQLSDKARCIDLVIDDGEAIENKPSTIVDVSDNEIKVLRKGKVEF